MAPADIDQLFTEFIESPDRESYLAIRRAIIASDAYQPYSEELQASGDYLHRRMLDQARAAVEDTMPNQLLSPQAHWLLAEIDSLEGDDESAERERMMATACIKGILSTGDGTEQQPYLVLHQPDEDALLTHLEKRPEFHDFRHLDERHFDVFRCADRSEIWFDVTDLVAASGATFAE